jgi:hypothetical protein
MLLNRWGSCPPPSRPGLGVPRSSSGAFSLKAPVAPADSGKESASVRRPRVLPESVALSLTGAFGALRPIRLTRASGPRTLAAAPREREGEAAAARVNLNLAR